MEESKMVMEKARPGLEALSQLAPRLNKATDLYMTELKEIEAELSKLNLGIEVELSLSNWIQAGSSKTEWDDAGEPLGVFYHAWTLGYGKDHRGNWCFLVREYKVRADDPHDVVEEDATPLLQASRDLRIAAAEKIPGLLKTIEQHVKKKIEVLTMVSDTKGKGPSVAPPVPVIKR